MPQVSLVNVIDGNTICVLVDNEQKTIRLARVCAPASFSDPLLKQASEKAKQYINDMLRLRNFRLEFVAVDLVEIYFSVSGHEFNIANQMILSGLAHPC